MSNFRDFLNANFHKKTNHPTDTRRIGFLDLAKGICIIIVVFLHADFSSDILTPLYLPLFFVLSRFFFKDYDDFMKFLVKKVNQLIILSLFFFAIGILVRISTNTNISILYILKQPFVKPTLQNEPIWFLICLFWVNIFYYFVHKRVFNGIWKITI